MSERDYEATIAALVSKIESLQNELKTAQAVNVLLDTDKQQMAKKVSNLEAENQRLKEIIEADRRRRFSKSSEYNGTPSLFDEAETVTEAGIGEETPLSEEVTDSKRRQYTRHVSRNAQRSLAPDTPVVDIYENVTVPSCPRCKETMVQSGEKVFDSVTRITKTVIVRRHVPQFECPVCLPDEGEAKTVTPNTDNMLEGTICDPSFLAQIIYNKYALGLPLYRQEKDLEFSRKVLSAWIMMTGKRLVKGFLPCFENWVNSYPLLNVDETPVEVLQLQDKDPKTGKIIKKGKDARYNGFMLVKAAVDRDGQNGPVLFTFSDNRRNKTIEDYLTSYSGVVQTDGLRGYAKAEKSCNFVHLGCLVHARRKAIEAAGNKKSGVAADLVKLYGKIFHEEGILTDKYRSGELSDQAFLSERKEKLSALFDELKKFLNNNLPTALPGTKLETALTYPLVRWDSLTRFLDYSFATSSNQRAENAIRPFVVGRKAWLFCITEDGADVSALFYSIIESCKALGLDAQDYLTYLFMHANLIDIDDSESWSKLLPGKFDATSEVADYRKKLLGATPDPNRTEPYVLRGKAV